MGRKVTIEELDRGAVLQIDGMGRRYAYSELHEAVSAAVEHMMGFPVGTRVVVCPLEEYQRYQEAFYREQKVVENLAKEEKMAAQAAEKSEDARQNNVVPLRGKSAGEPPALPGEDAPEIGKPDTRTPRILMDDDAARAMIENFRARDTFVDALKADLLQTSLTVPSDWTPLRQTLVHWVRLLEEDASAERCDLGARYLTWAQQSLQARADIALIPEGYETPERKEVLDAFLARPNEVTIVAAEKVLRAIDAEYEAANSGEAE